MILFGQEITWGNHQNKIIYEILYILYQISDFLYRTYNLLNDRYSRALVLRYYKALTLLLLLLVIPRPLQLKIIMHVNFWSRCVTQYSTTEVGYWKHQSEMSQVFCKNPDDALWLKEKKAQETAGQYSH